MEILLFIIGITQILYIRCQVTIKVEPASVYLGETVQLTCNYTGGGPESGVKWFRIGDSEGVIYEEQTAPNCSYYSGGSAYNLSRFTTTCDNAGNNYTLSFKVLDSDFETMWCCSYIIGGDNFCEHNASITRATTSTPSVSTPMSTTETTSTPSATTSQTTYNGTNNQQQTSPTSTTNSQENENGKDNKQIIIISVSVSGGIILLGVTVIIIWRRREKKKAIDEVVDSKGRHGTPNPQDIDGQEGNDFTQSNPDKTNLSAQIHLRVHSSKSHKHSPQDGKDEPLAKEIKSVKQEITNL